MLALTSSGHGFQVLERKTPSSSMHYVILNDHACDTLARVIEPQDSPLMLLLRLRSLSGRVVCRHTDLPRRQKSNEKTLPSCANILCALSPRRCRSESAAETRVHLHRGPIRRPVYPTILARSSSDQDRGARFSLGLSMCYCVGDQTSRHPKAFPEVLNRSKLQTHF